MTCPLVRGRARDRRTPEKRVRRRCYLGGVPGEADRVIYRTATSLDGFIADKANSLAWLFSGEHDDGPAGSARAVPRAHRCAGGAAVVKPRLRRLRRCGPKDRQVHDLADGGV
jgi:hypothetical protein